MDLRHTEADEDFRRELTTWLDANLPQDMRESAFWADLSDTEQFDARRTWEKSKAAAGFAGIAWPTEYGGRGGTPTMKAIYDEEMAKANAPHTVNPLGLAFLAPTVMALGTEQQKQDIIKPLLHCETIWCQGFSEPDSGSDLASLSTTAVLDGDEWVLNGSKAFITNCGTDITSIVTVTARTDDGISAFVVPAGTPGMIIEPAYDKLGWHASDTHGITFVDCRIPAENLLGAPGKGFRNFLSILDDGRIAISALALGSARACLEASVEYARQRHAFGGPIGRFQGLAFQLSDLAVQVENAYNLTYKAAWLKDQGRPIGQAAAMAKLYTTDEAQQVIDAAVQLFGGLGVVSGHPVERLYREIRALRIYEGASEVQKIVIARQVLAGLGGGV